MHQIIPATLAATLVAVATPVHADMTTFKAKLQAASEVPPNDSTAAGEISATYDTVTKMLSWTGAYDGLTGPETAAHFHGPAAPGANAGVVVPVDAKKSPFTGSMKLTDAQAADFMAGKWYFNVHTEKNKGGEIRGQMMK